MKLGALAAVAASLCVARVASADALTVTPEANDPAAKPIAHERRGGVVLGAAGGLGLASADGYPNNPKFYDDPAYYSKTPLLAGWSASFFAMLALTDFVSIGPTMTASQADTSRWRSTAYAGGLRAEFFPFVHAVPRLADLAFYGAVGVGAVDLRAKGPYPTSDGFQSFVALGVHHEWRFADFLGAHASVGPYLEYNAVRSEPSDRTWLAVGLRVALYTSGRSSE